MHKNGGILVREDQPASCQGFSCGSAPLHCGKSTCPGKPDEVKFGVCNCDPDDYGHEDHCNYLKVVA